MEPGTLRLLRNTGFLGPKRIFFGRSFGHGVPIPDRHRHTVLVHVRRVCQLRAVLLGVRRLDGAASVGNCVYTGIAVPPDE